MGGDLTLGLGGAKNPYPDFLIFRAKFPNDLFRHKFLFYAKYWERKHGPSPPQV